MSDLACVCQWSFKLKVRPVFVKGINKERLGGKRERGRARARQQERERERETETERQRQRESERESMTE